MTLPFTEAEIETVARQCGIPPVQAESLAAYLVRGRRPGHFLTAVLSNDLLEACRRADDENKQCFWHYGAFLVNYAPMTAWGSPTTVAQWVEVGGLEGYCR